MKLEDKVAAFLESAQKNKISDIHILPENTSYTIYFRVNGGMEIHSKLPVELGTKIIAYLKYLANMDVGEKRKPQSGSVEMLLGEESIDIRLSTIANYKHEETMVIRLLEQNNQETIQIQSFFQQELEKLEQLVRYKSGLILFSGPVDSGKTTTMYSLIKNRNTHTRQQVISIEDPVEIKEESFLQVQVNSQADITYESLLKASLRHHPDVIIVGEIRDEETARMVLRGALTGHLIIASVHAKNAHGVISRLEELGITREALKQTLIGIGFQKLVPIQCHLCGGNCHIYCNHLNAGLKRSALIDLRAGKDLEKLFHQSNEVYNRSFNRLLRKGYACGYITQENFVSYQIPEFST